MKTFNTIASELFSISEETIHDDLSSQDIPNWDSMNYLLFIAELEKEFGITFTMDQVMNAKTIGDLRAIVDQKK